MKPQRSKISSITHPTFRRVTAALVTASALVSACAPAPSVPATAIDPANPITFTGIGGVYPGQLATNAAKFGFAIPRSGDVDPALPCRTSHHATYPKVAILLDGPTASKLSVGAMYVTDSRFSTSAGLRVGSSLSQLQSSYGTRLKVFSPDWNATYTISGHPVSALYQKVAVVLWNDRGITYYLDGSNKVTQIKISTVNGLGDDEGCV